ncbi:MAG TPA: helix-turn-helix transcriptional regulator, partial [Candidatus Caccousia stercoris]|nr:helix-turn-helix transcriptional regulator [Candidatus Caccousia stercoris]
WKLAEQIRAYRQEKGMTQERLAEAVGVTVGAVSKWESGASVPELSVLVELASLFGTSVDTLIGYEVPDNALPALLRRLRACRDAHQFDEGNEVARRLLRCYPNSFEAVYHTAGFYYCQGLTQAENQEMRRAIALYERSLALLSQNTDPEIGEISIRESIASARISLGEEEEGVRELKQHNDNEIYDSLIGITLAYTDQKDEARRYLFRSYLRLTADLVRISFGFVNTAEAWDEQKQVLELFDRVLYFLDGMTEPGRVSFVTKAEALILAVCAHLCVGLGQNAEAETYLRRAWETARHFDAAPDYSATAIHFCCGDPPPAAFDDIGETAMRGVERFIKETEETAPVLWPLWEGWSHEKA